MFPATNSGEPARRAEVIKRHHWLNPVFAASRKNPSIMVENRQREMIAFGLDTSPLNGKPVRGQSERRKQANVVTVPMPVVAGIERRFGKDSGLDVFEHPKVTIYVLTFDLVRGGSGAP